MTPQFRVLLVTPLLLLAGACGPRRGNVALGQDGIRAVAPHRQASSPGGASAADYLAGVQDRFDGVAVYSDSDAAGNTFVARGRLSSPGGDALVPPMDEACPDAPYRGMTCIRCRFRPSAAGTNWGGWYFLSGTLRGHERTPTPDFGTAPDAGQDLTGAAKITFYARSSTGARVEFFAFGVGRDPYSGVPTAPHPDSAPKVSLGVVSLGREWRAYTLSIPPDVSLRRVIGGFAWVCTGGANPRPVQFDLDEIRYDLVRRDRRGFLVSFETKAVPEDRALVNCAFSYDNALAAIAFLEVGQRERARRILDGFLYAVSHDRTYSRKVRVAYQAGALVLPPGWTPNGKAGTVRLPGWYDPAARTWYEDSYEVSATNSGVCAWVCLALLAGYDTLGDAAYLETARALADTMIRDCWDERGAGGFTAGQEGFDGSAKTLQYKATEHSIDLYPVVLRLLYHTKDEKYRRAAEHARRFIAGMWDAQDGHFWTGTTPDGITLSKEVNGLTVIPTDLCAWSQLSLGREASRPYWRALDFALAHMKARAGGGLSFSSAYTDATWYEGSGMTACAAYLLGQTNRGDALVAAIQAAGAPNDGVPATNADSLRTGFYLSSGKEWRYYHRLAVAPTAWLVIAQQMARRGAAANPYWFGHPGPIPPD